MKTMAGGKRLFVFLLVLLATRDWASAQTVDAQVSAQEVQIHNQYCAGDFDQMQAALDQWKTTNADRFQTLHQLAISLAPPATTISDTSTSESTNP